MKKWSWVCLCFLCAVSVQAATVTRMRQVMGTLLEISVESKDNAAAEHAVSAGFDEVERWDSILSNHKEDSELSQLNSNPRQGVVSDDMFHFVSTARYWSERTNGAFDVTVEPLTRLWHLRERTLDRIPANKEIAAARALGYRYIAVSSSAHSVLFSFDGMGLDTGGIGKGYALDRAMEKMRNFEMESCTLNFGGQILHWSAERRVFEVGVKNPVSPGNLYKTYQVKSPFSPFSFSTSANYERYVTVSSGIVRVGHIRTQDRQASGQRNPQCHRDLSRRYRRGCDGQSSFVNGRERGQAFIDLNRSAAALILYKGPGGQLMEQVSANWKKWCLAKEAKP